MAKSVWPLNPVKSQAAMPMPQPMNRVLLTKVTATARPRLKSQTAAASRSRAHQTPVQVSSHTGSIRPADPSRVMISHSWDVDGSQSIMGRGIFRGLIPR